MELIRTRLVPPAQAGGLLERPRLSALLDQVRLHRLTIVEAPAGFGKTSLLSQWHQSLHDVGEAAGWLTADTSDADPVTGLANLAGAVGMADMGMEVAVAGLLQSERYLTEDTMATAVTNLLATVRGPMTLFVDDVHVWPENIARALMRVIELSGPRLHFVVAARTVQNLNLARMRARGGLLELGPAALRFDRDEVTNFMRETCRVDVGAAQLDVLEQRIEGWAAGLKLLSLSVLRDMTSGVAGTDGSALAVATLAGFSGAKRVVCDFFAEEVVAALPEAMQRFMMQTAVLERFNPALCQAVTGRGDARQVINDIERSSLFLQQLDDERTWYRYHHLFAEFLRTRLREQDPEAERAVYERASAWFRGAGLMVESIECALKGGDFAGAAELLEECCLDFAYTGRIRLVAQFAQQIPEPLRAGLPNVLLTWAWLLTRNLRFEDTRRLLLQVRETLKRRAADPAVDARTLRPVQVLLAHREMTLSAAEDRIADVEAQCRALMEQDGDDLHPYLRGTIYAHLQYALREQFQFGEVDRLAAMAEGTVNRSGFSLGLISVESLVGQSLFFLGRTGAALRALEAGRQEAIRFGWATSGLAALPGMPLAALLYDRNELAQAQSLLDDGLAAVTELGLVDQILPAVLTQARLHAAAGRDDDALRTLDDGMVIALDRGLERLRLGIVAERIRLLLRPGRATQAAVDYARAAGLAVTSKSVLPRDRVTTQDESRAIAWLRVAMAQDRLPDALSVARHWRGFCATRGAVRSLIQWNILLAELLFLSGDQRAAQRALREAMGAAAPLRAMRCFLDEGPVIQTLLESSHEGAFVVQHPTDLFARELLAVFAPQTESAPAPTPAEQPSVEGLFGQLSAKEQEILSLVGAGMRNREVANRLGTTEAAIKWHLQQVFDKVGTRRRSQAVQMARQMGLVR